MSSWVPLAMGTTPRSREDYSLVDVAWEGDGDRRSWGETEAGGDWWYPPVGTLGALAFSEREGEP